MIPAGTAAVSGEPADRQTSLREGNQRKGADNVLEIRRGQAVQGCGRRIQPGQLVRIVLVRQRSDRPDDTGKPGIGPGRPGWKAFPGRLPAGFGLRGAEGAAAGGVGRGGADLRLRASGLRTGVGTRGSSPGPIAT